jgi:hypothetical protein
MTVCSHAGLFPVACLKKRAQPLGDAQIPWSLRWKIALDIAKGARHTHTHTHFFISSFIRKCVFILFIWVRLRVL